MMWLISACIAFTTWYLTTNNRYKFFYIVLKTLPRDVRAIIRISSVIINLIRTRNDTVPRLFQRVVKKHPDKVAFYFEDQSWTFQEIEDLSNQVANYFKQSGFQPGDSIALLLENRPEYVALWVGLAKVRVAAAFINTNLVGASLVHSIRAAHCKALIYGSDFENAVNGIHDTLTDMKMYRFVTSEVKSLIENAVDLKEELKDVVKTSPDEDVAKMKPGDKLIYIYTSGTTGLPKAAIISNSRYIFVNSAVFCALKIRKDDIIYNCLPLYHSAGSMVSVGQVILFGLTSALRRKFSASNYWKDCAKYKCTVAIYIGELCRYLLAAHEGKPKVEHCMRLMAGNGLKREVWEKFAETFGVKEIYEYYGSTEGNSNMVNFDGKIGAVGCIPVWLGSKAPLVLIKCDEDTKEPLRGENGFCIMCKPCEPGILIGKIHQKIATNAFTGYADKKETNKKILKDVFKKGDRYFNSGDILVSDEYGYYYFKDRTGDTFRWKGENVATTEVESVISNIVGMKDAIVYGVLIPNVEGRAGMMALVDPDKTINLQILAKELKRQLPSYAIPLFLRILSNSLPMTGTFKIKKIELQKEGYDIEKIKDDLYFYDAKNVEYVPLKDVYEDIKSGKLRL